MQIDINATIIPNDRRIWRMFPGKSYRLLPDFLENRTVFLEQPNLLGQPTKMVSDPHLHAKVYAADLLAFDRRNNGTDSDKVFEWQDYVNYLPNSDLNRKIGATKEFYSEAKLGDIVIVPDHKSRGDTYIGSFTENADSFYTVSGSGRFENLRFQGRPVKWIARVFEGDLSPRLSRSLRHEHAFTSLDPELWNEVYSLAYGNFVGNGVHSTVIYNGNHEFRDIDNTIIGVIFKLSARACKAYDEGKERIDIGSLIDFLTDDPPLEYACLLSAEYHSPGFSRYVSTKSTATVAIAIMTTMIALGGKSEAKDFKKALDNVEYINSKGTDDIKCPKEMHGPADLFFSSIDGDKLRRACYKLKETSERARLGIKSKANQ